MTSEERPKSRFRRWITIGLTAGLVIATPLTIYLLTTQGGDDSLASDGGATSWRSPASSVPPLVARTVFTDRTLSRATEISNSAVYVRGRWLALTTSSTPGRMVLVRMANGTILSSYLLPLPFTASCAPAFLSNQTPPLVTCLNNPSIVGLQDSNGAVQQIVHLPGGVEMYDVAGRPSGAVSITRWAVRDSNHVQIVDVALSDRGRVAETSTMTVTIPQQYRIATSSFGPSIYAGAVGRASDGTLGMAFVDARSGCLITMEVSAAGQLRWVSEDAHLCSNSGPYFDGIEFSNEHMFLAVNGLFFHAVLSYAGSHLLWSHTLHDKAQTSFGWPDQFTLSKAGSPILAGIGHGSLFHEAPNANPSVYGLFIVKFVASSGATTSTAMIRSQLVYRRAYSLLSPIGIAATRDGTNVAERPWTNKWPATAASVPFAVLVEPTTT